MMCFDSMRLTQRVFVGFRRRGQASAGLRVWALVAACGSITLAAPAVAAEAQPVATQPASGGDAAAATTQRALPKVEVGNLVHDFGEAWAGTPVKHTFTLKNVGEGPLSILQVHATCGCTLAGKFDKVVAPGAAWELPAELRTTGMHGQTRKTINVTTDDPRQRTVTFMFQGRVKTRLSIKPQPVAYFTLPSRDTVAKKTLTITNELKEPVVIKSAKSKSKSYRAELREVEKGRKYELDVITVPPIEDIAQQQIVELETDNPEFPTAQVRVYTVVRARVTIAPPLLRFGIPIQKTVRHRIEVRNTGSTLVHVTGVKTSVPGLKTEIEEIQKGVTYAVLVTLPEGAELPDAGVMVTVHTDDPEFAELIARLQPVRFPPPAVSATRPTPAASQPSTE
ncbi:MAG: DUF1573 domain-containing protein [Phycisphaerae bacterium]|nr:DUF1573 domain-containing protein [Phycisphaerae bacterium]